MFIAFFYLLRKRGLDVSPSEWMTLMSALNQGMAHGSFTEFYHLCRTILVKSEAEFDKFDAIFLEYFRDIQAVHGQIPEEIASLLGETKETLDPGFAMPDTMDFDQMETAYNEMREAAAAGNGPQQIEAIGQQGNGANPFGKGGKMVGGASKNKSAFQIAESRTFRDFRNDVVMNERQFQMAFRRLREFSNSENVPEDELDIDRTIDDTCNSGGHLRVRMKKPRKNTIKLLLLMDSGGSMDMYSGFCTALFKAATKSNHFKDLKVYYFHNIIYNRLYTTPECKRDESVSSRWVLDNHDNKYKVIILGDAAMAPFELQGANYYAPNGEESHSGIEWLRLFRKKYSHMVWLNPMGEDEVFGNMGSGQFVDTQGEIATVVDMYPFTLKSFDKALKKLLVNH